MAPVPHNEAAASAAAASAPAPAVRGAPHLQNRPEADASVVKAPSSGECRAR